MRRKLTAITMAVAIMTTLMLAPMSTTTVQAQGGGNQPLLTVPLNVTQGALTFVGNLNILRFVNQGGQLVAVGNVVGTLTNTATGVVTPIFADVLAGDEYHWHTTGVVSDTSSGARAVRP